jgi:hypothetical protein
MSSSYLSYTVTFQFVSDTLCSILWLLYHILHSNFVSMPRSQVTDSNAACSLSPCLDLRISIILSDHRATVQMVTHWLPTALARVWAWVRSCRICVAQSGNGPGFPWPLWFPLQIIPLTAPHWSSSIICGWYSRPNDVCYYTITVGGFLITLFRSLFIKFNSSNYFYSWDPWSIHCAYSSCCHLNNLMFSASHIISAGIDILMSISLYIQNRIRAVKKDLVL